MKCKFYVNTISFCLLLQSLFFIIDTKENDKLFVDSNDYVCMKNNNDKSFPLFSFYKLKIFNHFNKKLKINFESIKKENNEESKSANKSNNDINNFQKKILRTIYKNCETPDLVQRIKKSYKHILNFQEKNGIDILEGNIRSEKVQQFWLDKETVLDTTALDEHNTNYLSKETKLFFAEIYNDIEGMDILELAAGAGRVTEIVFDHLKGKNSNIDVLEPSEKLMNTLKNKNLKIRNYFQLKLEDFRCDNQKYDIIHSSWILENLSDGDIVCELIKLRNCLKPNGSLYITENLSVYIKPLYTHRSQKIRYLDVYKLFFYLAKLKVEKNQYYGISEKLRLLQIIAMKLVPDD